MKKITVDGIQYAPINTEGMKHMIVIADNRGLAFVGDVDFSGDNEQIIIHNAKCIIRWGTSGHIAELANNGPQENTRLGIAADVTIFRQNLVLAYETDKEMWK